MNQAPALDPKRRGESTDGPQPEREGLAVTDVRKGLTYDTYVPPTQDEMEILLGQLDARDAKITQLEALNKQMAMAGSRRAQA